MSYTAGEAAKKLGITKDSLRYYEKEGLLPPISRNASGHRVFSDSDIDWIFLIRCLRDTDMPICKIKQYVSLVIRGDNDSIHERRSLLLEHEAFMKEKITTFQNLLKLIEKKKGFLDELLSSGSPDSVRCTAYAEEWERFRTILGGINHD